MNIANSTLNSTELSKLIVYGMQEKKAIDISIMDLRHISQSIADYFVICSGSSVNQVDAITDSIEETVYKQISEDPWKKEGKENREWILLDYVNVVVHIFRKDKREFYALEDLWGDAKISHID